MNARDTILNAIKANRPPAIELPQVNAGEVIRYNDLPGQFKNVLQSIGGTAVHLQSHTELKLDMEANKAAGYRVVNKVIALGDVAADISKLSAAELASVDIAYLNGELGVAENGCIWLYESQMGNRLLPFICQHLVLVIRMQDVVATMHDAYKLVETAKEGFGVFVAGPSKTADIEQSLVIGAHGARSLVVYILDEL